MKCSLSQLNNRDYLRAMSRAATSVTIVTTMAHGTRFGQTVSAFSRISDEPAVLGVCINRRSPLNDAIRQTGGFNVSVLGREHTAVADSFAGRGNPDRPPFTFIDTEWDRGLNDLPVFLAGVATFECELHNETGIGSHHLYLGEVQRVTHTDHEPLLHVRGNYRTLASHDLEGKLA